MTRASSLAAFAVATALLGGLATWWLQTAGRPLLPLPWTTTVAMATAAIAVVVLGLPVRRWTAGDRSKVLDPLRAARTVALAKAAAYAGALLTGWFFGTGLVLVRDLAIDPRRDRFILSMVCAVTGIVLCAAGLIVERWCRRPPDPQDDVDETAAVR